MQGYGVKDLDLWEVKSPGHAPSDRDIDQLQADLADSIRPFILSSKTLTPAVILLMQFRDIGLTHLFPVMGQLVAKGQSRLSEEWAGLIGYEWQVGTDGAQAACCGVASLQRLRAGSEHFSIGKLERHCILT